MASWQAHLFKLAMRLQKQRIRAVKDLTAQRHIVARTQIERPPADVRIDAAEVGVKGDWIIPPDTPENTVILYLHGGGYVVESPLMHRPFGARLARAAGVRLFMPHYRLAPEHPFPAALDDARAAYNVLLTRSDPAPQIILAGDSAGGGLALSLMMSLRDEGQPLPAAGVLISAWTDLTLTAPAVKARAAADHFIIAETLMQAAKDYANGRDLREPLLSPRYGTFAGLPPLLIEVGEDEILLDDSRLVAAAAQKQGVDVTLRVWPHMLHAWPLFARLLPEACEAIDEMAAFIKGHINQETR